MPTTSSCRFLRIVAHVKGSQLARVTEQNTLRGVLTLAIRAQKRAGGRPTATSSKPTSGEICDAAGVARPGKDQFAKDSNISSRGLIDSPHDLLGSSHVFLERGLQQRVSATQCRPPEFGRRAAISFAECGAEMAVTRKTQVVA